tara:strand:+ start:33 stop:350 length:318 start_codon:yes stop_codon:yes gene_type:complete
MTLRKLFKQIKIRSCDFFNELLDFNLKKLLFLKRLFILISITLFTAFFVFFSIVISMAICVENSISYIYLLLPFAVLFFPIRFLLKKIKSNFLELKYEIKAKKLL